jgi:hypothetical protein
MKNNGLKQITKKLVAKLETLRLLDTHKLATVAMVVVVSCDKVG